MERRWRDITLGEVAEVTGQTIRQTRQKLKEISPVWLNVEVNWDLLRRTWEGILPYIAAPLLYLLPGNEDKDLELPPAREQLALPPAAEESKHRPHWKRSTKLFQLFDAAWAETKRSYSGLIAYVKEQTGKGCSRRAIANWKRSRGLIEQ